jgi:hypothetical protein
LQGNWFDFRAVTLPITFRVDRPDGALERAVDRLCRKASEAVEAGYSVIILSTRTVDEDYAPIPTLLAVSAVHHHLIREGTRTSVALVVETGEAREIHHFACLLGYGASAINPYLAFETLDHMIEESLLVKDGLTVDKARANYIKAVNKGLLKVFLEDGHLDAAKLSRRPDLRGRRAALGPDRALLFRHAHPDRGRGPGRDRTGMPLSS